MYLLKKKSKGFTLVEIVVVILVITILAAATFLGGATVIKQSRKSKVQTNLSNYAAYVQDMFYAEPGVVNKDAADAETLLNNKYLTKDFQLEETKDAWNKPYEFYFVTDTVNAHKCTYVIISSNGSNGTKESYDLLTELIKNDHVSAQAALDSDTLMTGDDLGLVVLLRDGAVSSANYGFDKTSAAPTAITMLDGINQVYNGTAPLVFRSSAPMNTFVEVKVDDATVEPANYEVTSGSTIITFADAYARSLTNSDHTVEIVSTGGSASAPFKVEIMQEPGLYVTGSKTQFAKITLSGSQVDATWENIKAAYPDAFTTEKTISSNNNTSYFVGLSGDLIISNDITSIGNWTFFNCTGLTSITIPDGVTSIGDYVFIECTRLTSINVSASNTNYSSENGVLFNKNKTQLICYPAGKTETNYVIPNSVTSIDNRAFYKCIKLKSIIIPNSVTSIGDYAFNYCTLKSITIPNSVISIGNYIFGWCSELTSIIISNSVTTISKSAFYYCTSLTSVVIPNGVTSIGQSAFYGCTSLTSITIPDSVISISNGAFSGCEKLELITIPNSVTSIDKYAFQGCINLTSINIPDSVTTISEGAFENCAKLMEINVSTSNTNYSSENGILFNKNKTQLICYPSKKTETNYLIPNSVTSIGDNAFSRCTNLTSIIIPDSVTSIDEWTFFNCTSLTSVTVPNSVTSIGSNAFSGCENLTLVTFNGTKTQWNNITKGTSWKSNVPTSCKVHCTDGDVSI